MDPVREIAAFGISKIPDNLPTEHPLTQARIAVQASRGAVASFREEARQIRDSQNLTRQGKAAALGEAGSRKLAEIDFPSALSMLRGAIEELRKAREPDRSKDDSAARAVREQEIRDHLLQRGEPDRLQIFNQAIENSDRLIFDAVAKAPAFLAILPPDLVAQGQEAWLDQRSPEAAAKLRAMTAALAEVETATRVARREIASEAGLPGDDPVRAIAGGGEAAA